MSVFGNPFSYYRDPREEQRAVDALAARGRPAPGPDASSIAAAIGALAGQRSQPAPQAPAAPQEPDPVHLTALNALRAAAPPPPPEPEAEPEPEPVDHSGAYGALTAAAPRPPDVLPEPDPVDESPAFAGLAQAGRNRIPAPLPLKPVPVPVGLRGRVSTPDMDLSEDPEALALTSPTPRHVDYPGEVVVTASDAGRMHPSVSGKDFDGSDAGEGSVKNPLPGMDLEKDPNPPGKPAAQKEPKDPDQPSTTSVNGTPAQQRQESSDSAPDEPAPPGVNGWALAADILLNNGQGVNGIIGQANQQKAAWQANKRAGVDDQFKRDQHAVAAENARLRGEEGRLALQRQTTEIRKLEHPEEFPESPKEKAARENQEWQHKDASDRAWSAQQALEGDRSADNTRYSDTQAENERHHKALEAASGATSSELRAQREQKETDRHDLVETKKHEHDLLHGPIPGVDVVDNDAWESSTLNAGERGKLQEFVASQTAATMAAKKALEIAQRIGVGNPATEAKDIAEYRKWREAGISAAAAAGGTGVINPSELPRYEQGFPDITPGVSDVMDRVGGMFGNKQNTREEKLRGLASQIEALTNTKLAARGARLTPAQAKVEAVSDGPSSSSAPLGGPGGDLIPKPVRVGKLSKEAPAEPGELGAPVAASGAPIADPESDDAGESVTVTVKNKAGKTRKVTFNSSQGYDDFAKAHPDWEIVD